MKGDKPEAYIKGWVEFYKLRFKVTGDVLIPRPETELLVDEVLRFIYNLPPITYPLTILDLGTGSGAIAISVAKNLTSGVRVKIIATDISQKALKVAKQNAKLHGVEDVITFIQSDLLSAFCHSEPKAKNLSRMRASSETSSEILRYSQAIGSEAQARRDDNLIIVTNLPYIPTGRIAYLDSSVKDFEPFIALDGGDDGFELYRKLFSQIIKKAWKPKLIVGEIDYTHGELAVSEGQKYFPDAEVTVKKDLAHLQRILTIKQ